MADIEFKVDAPNDASLKVRFDEFDESLRQALIGPITALTAELLQRVHAAEPHKEGDLQGATVSNVAQGSDWMRGYVSVGPEHGEPFNIKAAALEYGAHKKFEVSGYGRTISQAFGEAIAPRQEVIGPYSRTPNIDEERYLRDPVAGMQAALAAAVEEALGGATKEFNE